MSPSESEKYLNIFLQETLFLARLQIARLWMRGAPPTLQQWIRAVNDTLPYKKVLYIHRAAQRNTIKSGTDGWRIPPPATKKIRHTLSRLSPWPTNVHSHSPQVGLHHCTI